MAKCILSSLALLATLQVAKITATPIAAADSKNGRPCTSFMLPVPITVHQHLYDIPRIDNNIDAASFEVALDTWSGRGFIDRIIGNITNSKTYNIYGELCVPPNGSKKNLLQIATHGGGFDHRYWDVEVEPEKYSYVDAVLEEGYSIFIYDRLTTGKSDKPDAYKEAQLDAEVEIARSITEIIKSGKISTYASNAITWDKYIHVGHSLGSIITYSLSSLYPDVSDGIVLTGFIPNEQFYNEKVSFQDQQYAAEAAPELFSDRGSGYTVPGTKNSLQVGFFSTRANKTTGIGGFDPKLLDYAWSVRQPQTVTELGSGGVLLALNPTAPEFKGPVQMVGGEYDFTVCVGDCRAYNQTMVDLMFPASKNVEVYLQPGTGHGLPFHKGAKTGYKATFEWLEKNGL